MALGLSIDESKTTGSALGWPFRRHRLEALALGWTNRSRYPSKRSPDPAISGGSAGTGFSAATPNPGPMSCGGCTRTTSSGTFARPSAGMNAVDDARAHQRRPRGNYYLWTDDNLSTTYLFDALPANDLALLRRHRNYGRVCCIKGFDSRSFAFNTRAAPQDYDRQFGILQRVLDLGLDVYGYVTLTSPYDDGVAQGVADLMDRLQAADPNYLLRVIPLRIQVFTPVEQRLARNDARERSLAVQEEAIAAWTSELERRFPPDQRALQICDVPLRARPT